MVDHHSPQILPQSVYHGPPDSMTRDISLAMEWPSATGGAFWLLLVRIFDGLDGSGMAQTS